MSQKNFIYDPEAKEFRPPDLDKKPDPRTNHQAASSTRPAVRKPASEAGKPGGRPERQFEPGARRTSHRTRTKGGHSKRKRNRKLLFWAMLFAVSIIWVSFLASTMMDKNKRTGSEKGDSEMPRLPGILE